MAFQPGIGGEQFDKLMSKTGTLEDSKMSSTAPGKNMLLDILNNHGDTLQQLALLAYLSKGEQAKPFLQVTTAAKVNFISNFLVYVIWEQLKKVGIPNVRSSDQNYCKCIFRSVKQFISTFPKQR